MTDQPDALDADVPGSRVDDIDDAAGAAADAADDAPTGAPPKKKGKKKSKQLAAEAIARNRRLRTLLVALSVVTGLLLAGCVVLAVWLAHDENTLSSRTHGAQAADSLRAGAVAAAQRYVTDFSTFDYRSLDTTFAHTAAELTGSFKTTYTQTSAALKTTLSQYHEIASTKVIAAAAQSVSATQAKVIVLFDQTVTSLNSKNPVVNRNRATVTLDRNGSGWLMSALDLN